MAKDPLQLPPQALEAESAVLGAMLIEPDAVERAMDILGEKDFYQDSHRVVFRVMGELANRSAAVDLVTVSEELRKLKETNTRALAAWGIICAVALAIGSVAWDALKKWVFKQ